MLKFLKSKTIKKALKQTWLGFITNLPIFLGVLLLLAIVQQYMPLSFLGEIENPIIASIFANLLGSIAAGNPVNSYIIAAEFGPIATQGFIIAVFLVAWITVGFVQIPAESYYFSKKYAITRNLLAFLFCFVVGFLVYSLYMVL